MSRPDRPTSGLGDRITVYADNVMLLTHATGHVSAK